ncbi:MAG: hypothetical protein LW808_001895 [Verrucomicrobiota bacterium]|nr:MAG: hypothetical protein LW808_001895 [Verrucomicrobiota bacterium]
MIKRIGQITKRLTDYIKNKSDISEETVSQFAQEIEEIATAVALRLPIMDQIRFEESILYAFGTLPKADDLFRIFTGKTIGALQNVTRTKLAREKIDKTLPHCRAALEKAQAKIAESKLMRGAHRHTTATRFAR